MPPSAHAKSSSDFVEFPQKLANYDTLEKSEKAESDAVGESAKPLKLDAVEET